MPPDKPKIYAAGPGRTPGKPAFTTELFKNAAVAAFSIVLSLLLAEAGLRLTPYRDLLASQHFSMGRFEKAGDGYDLIPNSREQLTAFPEMPYKIWTNELGCFDAPYKGERDPILLVGDSFTWGFAPYERKYGTLLEKALARRVLKCGVAGYGTRQELDKARRIIKATAKPKAIIVGYFSNDLENDYVYPSLAVLGEDLVVRKKLRDYDTGEISVVADAQPRDMRSARDWLVKHSIVYKLLRRNAAARKLASAVIPGVHIGSIPVDLSLRDPDEYPCLEAVWRKHESNILDFKAYADSLGVPLVFVIIPDMQQVYGPFEPEGKADWGYYNLRLHRLFKNAGIKYLDLLPAFRKYAGQNPGNPLYWKKDRHTSISGNEVIARELYKYLKEPATRHGPEFVSSGTAGRKIISR